MAIGLKGSWKETKGMFFIGRLNRMRREFVYAWERAWRGYDRAEVWNIDSVFRERYIEILKDYKKYGHGLFNVPKKYRNDFNKLFFTDEETGAIVDTLIFHLEMMNDDFVEKKLYGKNCFDDDYDFKKDFSIEKHKHIAAIVEQNKDLFMDLFKDFFWELWD